MDYTKTCFVIMPFGTKPVGKHKVNFDRIYDDIFKPAICGSRAAGGRKAQAGSNRPVTSSPAISVRKCFSI